MIYYMYLASLCSRRNWPQPQFECQQTRTGFIGIARVNNREYVAETEAETPEVAQEMAASQAYVICRNFSLNNGMYPDQKPNDEGLVQGLPVAIGTGRRMRQQQQQQQHQQLQGNIYTNQAYGARPEGWSVASDTSSERRSSSGSSSPTYICVCGRSALGASDMCVMCLRQQAAMRR